METLAQRRISPCRRHRHITLIVPITLLLMFINPQLIRRLINLKLLDTVMRVITSGPRNHLRDMLGILVEIPFFADLPDDLFQL